MGRIQIRIIAARSVADPCLMGTPDPYIMIKVEHQNRHTTVCQKQINPVWNESFDFNVFDVSTAQVVFELWNKNPIKDDFMGAFTLPISQLYRGQPSEDWCQFRNGEFVTGELHLAIMAIDFGLEAPQQQLMLNQMVPMQQMAPAHAERRVIVEQEIIHEQVPITRNVNVPVVASNKIQLPQMNQQQSTVLVKTIAPAPQVVYEEVIYRQPAVQQPVPVPVFTQRAVPVSQEIPFVHEIIREPMGTSHTRVYPIPDTPAALPVHQQHLRTY